MSETLNIEKAFPIGSSYKDFIVEKNAKIEELQLTLIELNHKPTGARVMHLACDDDENLFCLSQRTYPHTSNGVAHILEHTVLCGSEKFPVKDPFFSMIRRSLNTFMNALTGSDFTCYPASSCSEKDFYNLLDVYIDAVFFPKLREMSFLQEGHRLEFQDSENADSPLMRKGIVYNEMKGALSSSTARLYNLLMSKLMPDTIYGIDSGGEPSVIPELSYEELRAFHKKYYAPGHCLFFFYGNLPLEKHLDFISDKVLAKAERPEPLEVLKKQARFKKPLEVKGSYPIAADEDSKGKALISFGWLTCSIQEQEELLALELITNILMENDASPLKRALLESKLCKEAMLFLENEIAEVPAIMILKGCDERDAPRLWRVIESTLSRIVSMGFEHHLIEASLHQLEFDRLEIGSSRGPYGLSLFMRAALLEQHDAQAKESLKIHTLFKALRQKLSTRPHYLEGLIEKYFLKNTHRIDLTLMPDPELLKKEANEERKSLDKIASRLSSKEKEAIVRSSQLLKSFQNEQEKEDLSCLPKIEIQDIGKKPKQLPLVHEKIGPFDVYSSTCFTNEILYTDFVYDLPQIPEEDIFFLRLFSDVLTEVGNKKRDYVRQLEYVQANLGDISCHIAIYPNVFDSQLIAPTLRIQAKAQYRNAQKLFEIVGDLICDTLFKEKDRLQELIEQEVESMTSHIVQNAMGYAQTLSVSGLSDATFLSQRANGIDYLWFLKDLAANFDEKAPALMKKLEVMKGLIFADKVPSIVISCSEPMLKKIHDENLYDIRFNEQKGPAQEEWHGGYDLTQPLSQGRLIPSGVFFTSQSIPIPSYSDANAPLICLASHLFENTILHKKIREQGGAYGGGCRVKTSIGALSFYAYRDPHLASTLSAFKESAKCISEGKFTDEDLDEAKRAVIQGLDTPIYPHSRASVAYSEMRQQKTYELKKQFRTAILEAKKESVMTAVKELICPKLAQAPVIAFGNSDLFEKESQEITKALGAPLALFPT
jgi:presequence protease